MSWIATGVAGVGAGVKLWQGISQNHKASQIERNNQRPLESVQPEYQQNVNTAQQMAQSGLPTAQYNFALNNLNRNTAGGLASLNRSPNSGSGVAALVRGQNDATLNLDAQSAQMRNQNLLNLMRQKAILAQQKQAAFDWNYKQKYGENLANSQALRGAGIQNIAGAGGDVAGIGGALLMGGKLGSMFGKKGPKNFNGQWYSPDVNGNYTLNEDIPDATGTTIPGYATNMPH